jgi:hypothetical protein
MLSTPMLLIISTLVIVALASLLQLDVSANDVKRVRVRRDDERR